MMNFFRSLGFCLGCLFALILLMASVVASWLIVCGIVYAITLCFGWAFSWAIASVCWIAIVMIMALTSPDRPSKKRGDKE